MPDENRPRALPSFLPARRVGAADISSGGRPGAEAVSRQVRRARLFQRPGEGGQQGLQVPPVGPDGMPGPAFEGQGGEELVEGDKPILR